MNDYYYIAPNWGANLTNEQRERVAEWQSAGFNAADYISFDEMAQCVIEWITLGATI